MVDGGVSTDGRLYRGSSSSRITFESSFIALTLSALDIRWRLRLFVIQNRMRAMCEPADEVAGNIRKQNDDTLDDAEELDISFFAGVTLEEMEELQRMDSF